MRVRVALHPWSALLAAVVLAVVLLVVLSGDREPLRLLPPGGPEGTPPPHLGLRVPGIAAVDDYRGGDDDAWRDRDPFRAWWARGSGGGGGQGTVHEDGRDRPQPPDPVDERVLPPHWPGLAVGSTQPPRLVAVTEAGGVARVTIDLADGQRHRLTIGEQAACWRLLAVAAGQAFLEDHRGQRLALPLGIDGTTRLASRGGR